MLQQLDRIKGKGDEYSNEDKRMVVRVFAYICATVCVCARVCVCVCVCARAHVHSVCGMTLGWESDVMSIRVWVR